MRHAHLAASVLLLAGALVAAKQTKKFEAPKTFEEKEKIAVEMKKISKQLDVRCEYCHSDAERGLKEGDYTLLTREGEYAHEAMFPISAKYKVECSYCHAGNELTAAGERTHQDMKFMRKYKREKRKTLQCGSCHIPGNAGKEFQRLTKFAKKTGY
ncbi:multiheme c-type cytochrome [Turneriella parva]|uniref:multiheme c-type cytochrome n=1 Tax=Turneriella parva TaxID=29510 RepID=UPI00030E5466|nr:hypothetical protein [Turneriella parva]